MRADNAQMTITAAPVMKEAFLMRGMIEFPRKYPPYVRIPFQTNDEIRQKINTLILLRFNIPAVTEITDRTPGKNLFMRTM